MENQFAVTTTYEIVPVSHVKHKAEVYLFAETLEDAEKILAQYKADEAAI